MIVDDALTETEAILLDAALADDLPDGVELPDRVLQILHDLLDPSEYAEVVDGVTKAGNPEPLRRYWTSGKGGASIGWGSDGDFTRCVAHVSKYMDTEDAKGYCNLRHKEATGKYPGEGRRKTRKAIVVVEDIVKHLPGKHDQSSHGRKGGGEGYVPMSPDRSEWPADLDAAYDRIALKPPVGGGLPARVDDSEVQAVLGSAHAYGMSVGMTDEEATIYANGITRAAIAERVRRAQPLEPHEQAAYAEKLARYREEGRVCIAMDEAALDGMRTDGRYMTQFEIGYSGGSYNPRERAAAEVELFNHHPNVPGEKRTTYGFVSLPGMESQLGVSQYGDIRVVLKPDVANRTTMVVGDSLSTMAKPVPLKGPADYDLDQQARGYPVMTTINSGRTFAAKDPGDFVQDDYVEAQIHGGVKWTDVAEVHLPTYGGDLTEYHDGWLTDLAQGGVKVVGYDRDDADSGYFPDYVEKATGVLVATRRDGARLYRIDERTGYIETDRRRYAPRPLMALEARGGWIDVTAARVVVEKHLPGKHDQQSHGGGRFGTHDGMRVGDTKDDAKAAANLLDDPTRMGNLPEELQARMLSSAAEIGATPESLEAHIEESLAKAGGPGADGHDWYEKAHGECQSIADDAGLTIDQATGAVAAISPQMAWGPNLAVARFLAENRDQKVDTGILSTPMTRRLDKGGKQTRTAYEWAALEVDGKKIDKQRRSMPSLEELQGKRFSDLDPYVAASLMKAHAQQGVGVFGGKRLTGPLSIADDITGKVQRVNFPPTIQSGRGLRIMVEGGDGNGLINGHKVRSFRNNLRFPTALDGDITIDSHAVSLALGRKVSSGSEEYGQFSGKRVRLPDKTMSRLTPGPTSQTLGVRGNYAVWADAYRRVADRHGLRPNQLQSITWIQWRREHPDSARTTHAMD
jgi:hypothetical protein